MISTALILLSMTASQAYVGSTYWEVDTPLSYRWDSTHPTGTNLFLDDTHTMTPTDLRYLQDRACVVWGRIAPFEDNRCRGVGITPLNDTGDGLDPYNGQSHVRFHTGPGGGTRGLTFCAFNALPFSQECDMWLDDASGWSTYAVNSANLASPTPITYIGNGRPGESNAFDIWAVLAHEVGHSLGLFHTVIGPSLNVIGPVLSNLPLACDNITYDCPIMSQGNFRVSWWPTIDDFRGMKDHRNLPLRDIEYSIWNIDAAGIPFIETSWTTLGPGNSTSIPYASYTSPRIDCAPDPIENGDDSCVMVIPRPDEFPQFITLDVGATSISGDAQANTYWTGGFAVDVAYGDHNRLMGVAKRPVSNSAPTSIITYNGSVGSTAAPSASVYGDMHTHGEARITYHEPSCSFVTSWSERDGTPRICSWDLDGDPIDCVSLPTKSVWPTETICDAHLENTVNMCRSYVHQYGNDNSSRLGAFTSYNISINSGDEPFSCFDGSGLAGHLSLEGGGTPGSYVSSLIVDGTSYGSGREAGQYAGSLYFMTEDRSVSNTTDNTVRLRLDAAGTFNPPDVSITTSMDDTGAGDLVNLTSWAWHEGRHRFVAVRLANR